MKSATKSPGVVKGKYEMTYFKLTGLVAMVLVASTFCSAQQKFPLRSVEWEATVPAINSQDTATVLPYCLNDETWLKAFTQMPSCTIQNFTMTSKGASYTLDCNMSTYRMNGKVQMTFDGMEHMTANGSIDMTMNGKTTHSTSVTDYRWKGATCSPNDLNLRVKRTH
jgi:hypothetical protein